MANYIYVGGDTYRKARKMDTSNMSFVAETAYYANIYTLGNIGADLLVGGAVPGDEDRFWRIDVSDMSISSVSAIIGETIYSFASDGTYLYVGGNTKIWRLALSDILVVVDSLTYGYDVRALAYSNGYLYAGGGTGAIDCAVWKIDVATFTKVAESPAYEGNGIMCITILGDYVYCAGRTVNKVWKINPSDMSKVAESGTYGADIYSLYNDGTYIYCGGITTKRVYKLNANLSKLGESGLYAGVINAITGDGTYIYFGGGTGITWKVNPSNMGKVAESGTYGAPYGTIFALHYIPTGATVTTNASTQISYHCALGNGEITSATNASERGFEIKLEYAGTLYGYIERRIAGFNGDVNLVGTTWVGTLVKTEKDIGSFAQGAYSIVLGWETVLGNPGYVFSDKLFPCENYTYRAYAIIDGGTYYGEYVAFKTLCYPAGGGPTEDDQIPIEDIIEPLPEPEEPWPPFEWPDVGWPDFDYPDIPAYDGSFIGMFYYRKAFSKKDLDELRIKCRNFLDDSVEYALVLNHNMEVLQQHLNMWHEYLDTGEYNTFVPIFTSQWVNELARKELGIDDFKLIINDFIKSSMNNMLNVNKNFSLIQNGLHDLSSDIDVRLDTTGIRTREVEANDPDAEMLKKKIDELRLDAVTNYNVINRNLKYIRAILI